MGRNWRDGFQPQHSLPSSSPLPDLHEVCNGHTTKIGLPHNRPETIEVADDG